MATLTANIPVSTDLYTINATSYDTFALTFVDNETNRSMFPQCVVDFDFAAIAIPSDLQQWVTITFTQPATGGVQVRWAGGVRVDPGVSISQAASAATTVYAFSSTGRDWTVFPSGVSGAAADLSSQYAPGFSRTVLPRKQAQTVVTSFATGHGWANAFSGTSAADTSVYLAGTQSLKMTGSNATTGVYKSGLSIDMTGRAWGLLLRVEDFSKLDQINLYAANTGETAYDVWTFARNDQYFKAGEWVWVSFPYGSNTTVGSTPRANVQRVTIRCVPLSGQTINVWAQQLVHFPVQTTYSTGVASISFDDGRASVMTAAKKMAAYGWRGQVYIIPEAVGTANYLTLDELKTLKNTYGWGIGLDGASSYLAMTAADLETYIRTNKQYLYTNGLVTSGVDHISYPGVGNVSDAVIAVTNKYAATAHTGVIVPVPSETIPPLDPNRLRSVTGITSHSGGISLATAQGYIDAAVANDGWLNLIFHGVVTPTTATTEITPTDFDTMLAYLASSTISVVPIGDVMRA